MNLPNIFANIPDTLPAELFEKLAGNDQVTIERIISRGHSTPDGQWYDQTRNEWVILLSGSATLEFAEGEQKSLKPGDHLLIPAHCKHRVNATAADGDSVWLAVHF